MLFAFRLFFVLTWAAGSVITLLRAEGQPDGTVAERI